MFSKVQSRKSLKFCEFKNRILCAKCYFISDCIFVTKEIACRESQIKIEMSSYFFTSNLFKKTRLEVNFTKKRKCAGRYSSAPVGAVQFHQQIYNQLSWYAPLENTLDFYTLSFMLCASRIGIRLLV